MSSEMTLSDSEITALRWMKTCNSRRVGFLGPTVRKQGGPLPELHRLEEMGLAHCITYSSADKSGYWLRPDGKTVLASLSQ